jgi:O-antigen ligase
MDDQPLPVARDPGVKRRINSLPRLLAGIAAAAGVVSITSELVVFATSDTMPFSLSEIVWGVTLSSNAVALVMIGATVIAMIASRQWRRDRATGRLLLVAIGCLLFWVLALASALGGQS